MGERAERRTRRNHMNRPTARLLRPMFDTYPQHCDFCESGHVTARDQHIAFRQLTDRGYVSCRVTVPVGVCDHCRSGHWSKEAEAVVEEAVRREYEKRPFAA